MIFVTKIHLYPAQLIICLMQRYNKLNNEVFMVVIDVNIPYPCSDSCYIALYFDNCLLYRNLHILARTMYNRMGTLVMSSCSSEMR